MGVVDQVERIEFYEPLALLKRFPCTADGGKQMRVPVASMGIVGVYRERPLKLMFGVLPFPGIVQVRVTERRVSLGRPTVQLQCTKS